MLMPRSLMLLSSLLLTGILSSCEAGARNASGYTGVPLPEWSADDQHKVADLINKRCCPVDPVRGECPTHLSCPPGAVLERAVLDYVTLRNENRAAGSK